MESQHRGVGFPSPAQELLLDAALGDEERALTAWKSWQEKNDFANMDNDSGRLLPLVGYNFTRLNIKFSEAPVVDKMTRLVWARNKFLFHSAGAVVQLLASHRIDVLFTKGIPLAIQHYPSSSLRPMGDGDILIRPSQFDDAIQVMLDAGWRYSLEQVPSAAHHAVALKSENYEVDVHRFALGECPFAKEDEDFWRDAVPLSLDGVPALATNATDLLFMTCVNSVHSSLRWVADAMVLIRKGETDWQRFLEQARSRKLVFVTRIALTYLAHRYDAPIPTTVLETLQAMPTTWLEKREYHGWDSTDSATTRLLLRFAAYRRVRGAQNPFGLLNHLRLHGDLNSSWQVPFWLLGGATQKLRSRLKRNIPSAAEPKN